MMRVIVIAVHLLSLDMCASLSLGVRDAVMDTDSEVDSGKPVVNVTSAKATYKLNDGNEMPVIGLGVYRMMPGDETYNSVKSALELGYRMIDTAQIYMNEADVGRAIRDSGIPRSKIWVTTKLWDSHHGYRQAVRGGKKSVQDLGIEYIDLLLIHSPGMYSQGGGKIVETYDALLALKKEGLVKSVGVSNFNVHHLEALEEAARPFPAVNQIELHPQIFKKNKELVEYCRSKQIFVQAYGSLLSGMADSVVVSRAISNQHRKSNEQVMLRWALDQGFGVIPKSIHRDRQAENLDVFDFSLSKSEVEKLNEINGVSADPLAYPFSVRMPLARVDVGEAKPEYPAVEEDGGFKHFLEDQFADAAFNTAAQSMKRSLEYSLHAAATGTDNVTDATTPY